MGSVSVRVWRVGVIGWGSVCSSGLMYWDSREARRLGEWELEKYGERKTLKESWDANDEKVTTKGESQSAGIRYCCIGKGNCRSEGKK